MCSTGSFLAYSLTHFGLQYTHNSTHLFWLYRESCIKGVIVYWILTQLSFHQPTNTSNLEYRTTKMSGGGGGGRWMLWLVWVTVVVTVRVSAGRSSSSSYNHLCHSPLCSCTETVLGVDVSCHCTDDKQVTKKIYCIPQELKYLISSSISLVVF